MKKPLTSFLALTLMLTSLTACKSSTPIDESKTESSFAESTTISSTETPSTSVGFESTVSTSDITPVEKIVGIYGETAIPDIHITSDGEGKALSYEESDQLALEQSLDSMIFETHTFGDYTVRLVGDKVRTDNEYFPGFVYAQNLRAEFERDGKLIEDFNARAHYIDAFNHQSMYEYEFRLIPEKIGSYLDWYELECPVLVLKFYYEDVPETIVKKAAYLFAIRDDELKYQLLGTFDDKGIGIHPCYYGENHEHPQLQLLDEDKGLSHLTSFSADRFTIADSNTLIDDDAGVKYTFDFEECFKPDSLGHLYTAEWIG